VCFEGDTIMSLLTIVITIVVVGVILWAINQLIPMAGNVKNVLNVVVVVFLVLWILQGFGFINTGLRLK